nr:ferric reductase-like transmembrane domain-containing protein [Roseivivax halodurans]
MRSILIWAALVCAVFVPLAVAAGSPLLEWRGDVYIAAGLAGVVALSLVLVQPLLAAGYLPGLAAPKGRRVHRWIGAGLVVAIVVHVGGLWVTSPPDVIDALLFTSPAPFSAWGVVAMWAAFASALVAMLRGRIGLRPRHWRVLHTGLVMLIAVGSVVHTLLIEGTMGPVSKLVLCLLVLAATGMAIADLRVWTLLRRRRT